MIEKTLWKVVHTITKNSSKSEKKTYELAEEENIQGILAGYYRNVHYLYKGTWPTSTRWSKITFPVNEEKISDTSSKALRDMSGLVHWLIITNCQGKRVLYDMHMQHHKLIFATCNSGKYQDIAILETLKFRAIKRNSWKVAAKSRLLRRKSICKLK